MQTMQTVVAVDGSVRSVRVGSSSRPGVVHKVVLSCSCEGFQYVGHCRHLGEAAVVLCEDTRAARLRTRVRLSR
jgi:hypothetical protein